MGSELPEGERTPGLATAAPPLGPQGRPGSVREPARRGSPPPPTSGGSSRRESRKLGFDSGFKSGGFLDRSMAQFLQL